MVGGPAAVTPIEFQVEAMNLPLRIKSTISTIPAVLALACLSMMHAASAQESSPDSHLNSAASSGNISPHQRGQRKDILRPDGSYISLLVGSFRRNLAYIDTFTTTAATEVEVRTAPDGSIVSYKLVKSSGADLWDRAVLDAIEKTKVLPLDAEGRVPPLFILAFSPR
jgi:colicin import membrane protein